MWAYFFPAAATHLTPYIAPGLGFIMVFTMGLTLRVEDFKRVAERPLAILIEVAAQYVIVRSCCHRGGESAESACGLGGGFILLGAAPGVRLQRGGLPGKAVSPSRSRSPSPRYWPRSSPRCSCSGWPALTDIDGPDGRLHLKTVVIPVVGGVDIAPAPARCDRQGPARLPWVSHAGHLAVVAALIPARPKRSRRRWAWCSSP